MFLTGVAESQMTQRVANTRYGQPLHRARWFDARVEGDSQLEDGTRSFLHQRRTEVRDFCVPSRSYACARGFSRKTMTRSGSPFESGSSICALWGSWRKRAAPPQGAIKTTKCFSRSPRSNRNSQTARVCS